ncbi:MAG: GDP-mannose 4,6-dehydratase, partial [Balneolaceae bacterium]|nr:GDP-mannose 4,6-dehydratase [Balneolaceae bacterium]
MNILVTGGAGFIGSNLLVFLHEKYPDYHFLNIDKLSYASDLHYLDEISDSHRYEFRKLDITNRDKVREVIREFEPEGVFHLAAESHVDNSIKGPEPFILSNVVGTFNLLEECRQLWKEDEEAWQNRFLHVSTDEVYGTLGDEGYFTEETPYAPNSPYSASKAGSDFIVRSYFHTYGMNVVTTNCSNNFGPHQHDEKLIPTVIRNAV